MFDQGFDVKDDAHASTSMGSSKKVAKEVVLYAGRVSSRADAFVCAAKGFHTRIDYMQEDFCALLR